MTAILFHSIAAIPSCCICSLLCIIQPTSFFICYPFILLWPPSAFLVSLFFFFFYPCWPLSISYLPLSVDFYVFPRFASNFNFHVLHIYSSHHYTFILNMDEMLFIMHLFLLNGFLPIVMSVYFLFYHLSLILSHPISTCILVLLPVLHPLLLWSFLGNF